MCTGSYGQKMHRFFSLSYAQPCVESNVSGYQMTEGHNCLGTVSRTEIFLLLFSWEQRHQLGTNGASRAKPVPGTPGSFLPRIFQHVKLVGHVHVLAPCMRCITLLVISQSCLLHDEHQPSKDEVEGGLHSSNSVDHLIPCVFYANPWRSSCPPGISKHLCLCYGSHGDL